MMEMGLFTLCPPVEFSSLLERGSQLSGRSGSRLGSTSAAATRARATLAPATLPFCQDQSGEESIKDKEAAGFRGCRRQR